MYEFLISKFNGKRGPKKKLSLVQIIALNIYRFHFKTGDLKNYHKMIRELMSDKVPNLPNYENFMKATNKSTKGWWYGFKMSGICNEQGGLENSIFTHANIADCRIAEKLAEAVSGTIFADAGYLQKKDALNRMEEKGMFRHFFYSIVAYMINRNLDFYKNFFRLRLI